MDNKIPIVYHDKYNIRAFGLEKLHPFDVTKYERIYKKLKKEYSLTDEHFYNPTHAITDEELSAVQSIDYLKKVREDKKESIGIFGVPELKILPNALVNKLILDPMRWATTGTSLAMELAHSFGWSINLGGGYHHASKDFGGGFCAFADTPLAIHKYWESHPNGKVMIIDTDAHHGNGNEDILGNDPRICIVDINGYSFHDSFRLENETPYKVNLFNSSDNKSKDSGYLNLIRRIEKQIDDFNPDFIVHNAGSDILDGDNVGGYHVSGQGLIRRDEIIWRMARSRMIPIMYVFAGGYTKKSAGIIFESIKNLIEKQIISLDCWNWKKSNILPEEPYYVPDIVVPEKVYTKYLIDEIEDEIRREKEDPEYTSKIIDTILKDSKKTRSDFVEVPILQDELNLEWKVKQ